MRTLLLAMLAACGAHADAAPSLPALMAPISAEQSDEIAKLRAEGPAALDRLLAVYDALGAGAEREQLGDKIDRVAAQRYATVSRMFWYTDLPAAKAAAKQQGKPILMLRMLGRLDEDLSCANSRYFRIALYANTELSKFLREHFILAWSSERAVPRVTIDFGDGRKLERTITGNSAHYVLDAEGRPIDVLPGLYAPAVFRQELERTLAFATTLPKETGGMRDVALGEYHREQLAARMEDWKKIAKVTVPNQEGFRPEAFAQLVTITKSGYELPTYRVVDLGVKMGKLPDDAQVWAQVGVRLMPPAPPPEQGEPVAITFTGGGRLRTRSPYVGQAEVEVAPMPPIRVGEVLDGGSKALLARLSPLAWSDKPVVANAAQLGVLVNRFERDILADTAINEFDVRAQIHGVFINSSELTFESLNEAIYSQVFHTPKGDPWLGLSPAGVTALPADGLVSATRAVEPPKR